MLDLGLETTHTLEPAILNDVNVISVRNRTPALAEGLITGQRLVVIGRIHQPRFKISKIGPAESPFAPLALEGEVVFLNHRQFEIRIDGGVRDGCGAKRRSGPEPGKRIGKGDGGRQNSIHQGLRGALTAHERRRAGSAKEIVDRIEAVNPVASPDHGIFLSARPPCKAKPWRYVVEGRVNQ